MKWLPDGSVALGAYKTYDRARAARRSVRALLVAFDGRAPVATVRARIRAKHQAGLDDEVLLALYRHRVLVATEA